MAGENETVDRGDEWTPTDDDAPVTKVADKAEKAEEPPPKVEKKSALKTEPAADVDPDADLDATAADDKKSKDTRIPAARHKEILDKERGRREAVEVELAKYKQGEQIADLGAAISEAETKLITLEKTYAKQLTDGEADKAAETMAQIRRTERAINEQSAQVREKAAEARAVERVRFDVTVERLEAQYPELEVGNDLFDRDKVAEILELKEAYQTKGYTPSEAIQKAVKLIVPPVTKAQEKALSTEARVDPKAVEAARKAAAVEKTVGAIEKTPANAAKVGLDSDKSGGSGANAMTAKDAIKLPHAEFIKLGEADLARIRGDVI